MSIKTENLYRKLFDNLSSQGFDPRATSAETGKTVVPEEADFLSFDFDTGPDAAEVTLSVEKTDAGFTLVVYTSDAVDSTTGEERDWGNLLPQIRKIAKTSGIRGFKIRNRDHLHHDLQKRDYMQKQEQIAEGYYPMGKKASYSDNVPNVKMVIQHSRQIEEGEQRYRNVARIFLENEQGERFLAPTTKPGIARVYARHIAEGGMPHDDRWNHIGSLVEEYQKMGAFVRATRNGQFNESAQRLVTEGINHYQKLRESLSKLAGHRGYNTYFESYTPPLMEDEEQVDLSEMFMANSLDPRIESVMPILSKLSKNLGEMKEIGALAEWADSLVEGGGGGEASEEPVEPMVSEEESLTSNNPVGIPESEELDEDEFAGDYKTGPAGQWRNKGPKANKPAKVGDLVGASESAEMDEDAITEMDSEGYTGSRDSDSPVRGPDKTGKMTTAKKMAQAGLNILNKQVNKVQDRKTGKMYNPEEEFDKLKNSPDFQAQMKRMATKEDVVEGQEDLDTIKRLLGK